MAFTRMSGFLLGCGPSPCSLSICSWYFYFYKVHVPIPLIFTFAGFLVVVPYGPIEVQVRLLRLHFLGNPRRARLVRPWCSLVSITSDSPALDFLLEDPLGLFLAFLGMLAWHVLGNIWHAFIEHSWWPPSRLIDSLLLGAILFAGRAQLSNKQIGPGLLVQERVVFSPYLSHFRLKDCLA